MVKAPLTLSLIIFISALPKGQGLELPRNPDEIVAKVDSINISVEEFYYGYEYGPAFIKREKNSKAKFLNYMMNEKLLALDGYTRQIDKTDQAVEMLDEFESDLATEELFKQDILSEVKIEDGELDTAVNKKNIELEIKWLYTDSDEKMKEYLLTINEGEKFDSLFDSQLNDSTFIDDRYLKIDRFKLEQMNPALTGIIDSLKPGEVSLPVHVDNGWYIIKLANFTINTITNEQELLRLEQEAVNALTKIKMDKLSDDYINKLMIENKPIIIKDAFNLLRSYLGNMLLGNEQYKEWEFSKKLSDAIKNLKENNIENFSDTKLVGLKNGGLTLKDFLIWYRNRNLYIKLDNKDLKSFTSSLEGLVWRMVRDKLLFQKAKERGLDKLDIVKRQSAWWKDKIVSSIVKNEIAVSVSLDEKENINVDDQADEYSSAKINEEFSDKLFRKINSLKKKYTVNIDQDILNEVPVSVENNPKAVEFYTVKKGGIIPRTPYPTIDYDWINWE